MKAGQIIRLKIAATIDPISGRRVERVSDGKGETVLSYFTRELLTPDNRGVLVASNRTGKWLPYLLYPDEKILRCLSTTPLYSWSNPAVGGERIVYVSDKGLLGYVPLDGDRFQAIIELPRGMEYSEVAASSCGRYAFLIYSEKTPVTARRISDGTYPSASSEKIAFGARTVMLRVNLDTGITKGLAGAVGCFAHPMIDPTDPTWMEYCAVCNWWHHGQRMWTIQYNERAGLANVRPLFPQRIGRDAVGHEFFLEDGQIAAVWTRFAKVGDAVDKPKESFILVAEPKTGKLRGYRTPGLLFNHLHGRDGKRFVSEGRSALLCPKRARGNPQSLDLLCRYDVHGKRTVPTVLCASGCSWKGQLGHPHAVVCRENRWCYFNSDREGRVNVYRVRMD